MAAKKSTFLSMVVALFLVTFIGSTILGVVHDLTANAIATSLMKAQNEAVKSVLPQFDTLGKSYNALAETGGDSLTLFPAYSSGKLSGVAVKTYSKKGFGGLLEVMVGFKPDGTVNGYQVLELKETPGLGTKSKFWFKDPSKKKSYIIGKNPGTTNFTVSKDGGDIDAITASTITSRAFLESIRRAYKTLKNAVPQTQGTTTSPKTEGGQK